MLYIGHEWVAGDGDTFTSLNPATQTTLWEGKSASAAQVAAATAAARIAQRHWRHTPLDARIEVIERYYQRLEQQKSELSRLISEETGKVRWDADGEVAATCGKWKFSLAAYRERTPERIQETAKGAARLQHRPHGVMAVYGPYNFPAHLPNGHITPALLAGNSIVFKPSEFTPRVGEWLVQQWIEAGLPDGVLNLIQGKAETGIALSKAEINGLLFTGSAKTGQALHKQFAGRPDILLALELGGNNPLIIESFADEKSAILETINSAYISTGQRCTCARRLILIESDRANRYLDGLVAALRVLEIGAFDANPPAYMGPVIHNDAAQALVASEQELIAKGAKPLTECTRPDPDKPFLTPALLDATEAQPLPDEEHFGPLLTLYRVKSLDEAIERANDTRFGLSAGLFSENPASFEHCTHQLQAGILNWNQQTTGASGHAPFGGIGMSGNHRPAGFYAADYCAYPLASMMRPSLELPASLPPGLTL